MRAKRSTSRLLLSLCLILPGLPASADLLGADLAGGAEPLAGASAEVQRCLQLDPQKMSGATIAACGAAIDQLQNSKADPSLIALALFRRGQAHEQQNALTAALADYDAAGQLAPQLPNLHHHHAFLLLTMKRGVEALAEADLAVTQEPGDAAVYYIRAQIKIDLGKYDPALADLDTALQSARSDTGIAFIQAIRGDAYRRSHRPDAAMAAYEKALAIDANQKSALTGKATILASRDSFDASIAVYDRILAHDQNDFAALVNRSYALIYAGHVSEVIPNLSRAIALQPGDPAAYAIRADGYRHLGEFDAAMSDIRQAIALDPQNSQRYYSAGLTALSMGDDGLAAQYAKSAMTGEKAYLGYWLESSIANRHGDESTAIADAQQAIKLQPAHAPLYVHAANVQFEFGHDAAAIANAEDALKLQSDEADALVTRGIARLRSGDRAGAIGDFASAAHLRPDSYLVLEGICYGQALGGMLGAAADSCDRALKLMPNDPAILIDRAYIKLRQTDWTGAKADLELAEGFDRRNPWLLFDRAFAEEHLGDKVAADTDYAAARAINPLIDVEMKRNGIVPGGSDVTTAP
jgi:tetratricopeptide (TPR) repeat protein